MNKICLMYPEQETKEKIEKLLESAGWQVQDKQNFNLASSLGIAIREFPLKTGRPDYALFVNRKAVGIIEVKKTGTTLSGVVEQIEKYFIGSKGSHSNFLDLVFVYEATDIEIFFKDLRDPEPRSRRVFSFHRPETLQEWLVEEDTLRTRLRKMPPLNTKGLRICQIEAIQNLEASLAESKPRALIQMATGAGKTYTAVSFIYRLIKYAKAKRILFLVDRNNLGRQTLREFQQYETPEEHRKFTELYNIQLLTSNTLDPVSKVCITTIQRLYSMLKGEEELDQFIEEQSSFENYIGDEKPKEITYNPQIPIETFDFIITDECHRSIYNLWRQVLEYFDAFIIGLTATPSKQTLGFFNQNLVTEYNYERAIADGVSVGYDVYRIKTEITEKGNKIEAGYYIDKRNKLTRKVKWELLDEDIEYTPNQLDREVVAQDQIRTIIKTFKEKLFTEIFPDRKEVPKTLVFAKNDSHAEDIVQIIREEFGKGDEFCKKITYRTFSDKPENLIASFRNSYYPRIVVTVDMISTGTDIKPIECILFMRDVRSRVYFEQMKGRGSRVISPTELRAVTPDAKYKTHFVIVDAVGVCEHDKTDSRPLERKRSIPFDKLLTSIAMGNIDEDSITSLAGRLARLDKILSENDKEKIEEVSGIPLREIIHRLFDAVDLDKKIEQAKIMFQTDDPTQEQVQNASLELIQKACEPFHNPNLRNILIEIRKNNEQIIDTISKDKVIFSGFDINAKEKARTIIETFKTFIEKNKNELIALQILYNKPYKNRHLTFREIQQLAEAIKKPPYNLTLEELWHAYEQLEPSKVRGAGSQKLLTDIISLVRFAIGKNDILEPFSVTVNDRFNKWLREQESLGKKFTREQIEWLTMIKEHIATSLQIEMEDFELTPFYEKGGAFKAYQIFGDELYTILEELNEVLVA